MLERYGEGFDPRTGTGDIEIWIPPKGVTNGSFRFAFVGARYSAPSWVCRFLILLL
jgi:hypothetical protein